MKTTMTRKKKTRDAAKRTLLPVVRVNGFVVIVLIDTTADRTTTTVVFESTPPGVRRMPLMTGHVAWLIQIQGYGDMSTDTDTHTHTNTANKNTNMYTNT